MEKKFLGFALTDFTYQQVFTNQARMISDLKSGEVFLKLDIQICIFFVQDERQEIGCFLLFYPEAFERFFRLLCTLCSNKVNLSLKEFP